MLHLDSTDSTSATNVATVNATVFLDFFTTFVGGGGDRRRV